MGCGSSAAAPVAKQRREKSLGGPQTSNAKLNDATGRARTVKQRRQSVLDSSSWMRYEQGGPVCQQIAERYPQNFWEYANFMFQLENIPKVSGHGRRSQPFVVIQRERTMNKVRIWENVSDNSKTEMKTLENHEKKHPPIVFDAVFVSLKELCNNDFEDHRIRFVVFCGNSIIDTTEPTYIGETILKFNDIWRDQKLEFPLTQERQGMENDGNLFSGIKKLGKAVGTLRLQCKPSLYHNTTLGFKYFKEQELFTRPSSMIQVDLSAKNLLAMDRNGLSDPFVQVFSYGTLVYTTEVIPGNLNPTFRPFLCQADVLCGEPGVPANMHAKLLFKVYDWDSVGEPDLIGEFEQTLQYLVTSDPTKAHKLKNYEIKDKKNNADFVLGGAFYIKCTYFTAAEEIDNEIGKRVTASEYSLFGEWQLEDIPSTSPMRVPFLTYLFQAAYRPPKEIGEEENNNNNKKKKKKKKKK